MKAMCKLPVKMAVEKGIKIFTIGMGLPQGARIPVKEDSYNQDFRRDKDGNFVITRLNEQMLSDIATGRRRQLLPGKFPRYGSEQYACTAEKTG